MKLHHYFSFVSVQCFEDAVHITAILGESVVFNCHVEFPEGHPVPYVLQWEKKVGEPVRFQPSGLSLSFGGGFRHEEHVNCLLHYGIN